MNVVRAVSSEGRGRIEYFTEIRRRLDTDTGFRDYFEGETDALPEFFVDRVRTDLGPLWEFLPDGALFHDPLAYLKEERTKGQETGLASLRKGSETGAPSRVN
jgi:hypothetical protein